MDDQISDPNAREENDDWSPSDGQALRRYWLEVARRGIAEGRKQAEERQRILDEQNDARRRNRARS